MLEACTALLRSPDPSTKHGAVIVNSRNRINAKGYNGFPSGGDDSIYPLTRPEKYSFVIHAEANAIFNCNFPPINCILYVTGMPCSSCIKAIIQSGIKKVIYGKIGSNMVDEEDIKKSKLMAKNHKVKLEKYKGKSPVNGFENLISYLKEKGWK